MVLANSTKSGLKATMARQQQVGKWILHVSSPNCTSIFDWQLSYLGLPLRALLSQEDVPQVKSGLISLLGLSTLQTSGLQAGLKEVDYYKMQHRGFKKVSIFI